jgi:ribosomal protein L16 Arg81 hydroxylase
MSVQRISAENISFTMFNRKFYRERTPLVVTDGIASWKAKIWTPDYLKTIVGDKFVNVNISKSGNFNPNQKGIEDLGYTKIKMKFSELVDEIQNVDSEYYHYLEQQSLPDVFPELQKDIGTLKWFGLTDFKVFTAFWLGAQNSSSPLHFDIAQNFFAQIYGRKRFTLFKPTDTQYLYPAYNKNYTHISEISFENLDYDKFPLIYKAEPFEVVLEPGDVLFLPERWWHHVKSLETSISVNYWWTRLLSNCSFALLKIVARNLHTRVSKVKQQLA